MGASEDVQGRRPHPDLPLRAVTGVLRVDCQQLLENQRLPCDQALGLSPRLSEVLGGPGGFTWLPGPAWLSRVAQALPASRCSGQ